VHLFWFSHEEKSSLFEGFHEGDGHGRAQAPWPAMGAHPEREGRGKGKGERGDATRGAPWGAAGGGPRSMAAWFGPAAALCVVCMRKKAWGRKEREEREKEKREKEKERKNENFAKPGNFRGEK
jgi:hypothetical protein